MRDELHLIGKSAADPRIIGITESWAYKEREGELFYILKKIFRLTKYNYKGK